MIDPLISIIDRLIKLKEYRGQRSDSRFKDVFKPAFDELLLVHKDYVGMFTDVIGILRVFDYEALGGLDDGLNLAQNPEMAAAYSRLGEVTVEAFSYLRQQRLEFEPVRIKLRSLARVLSTRALEAEDAGFVRALLGYLSPIESLDDRLDVSPETISVARLVTVELEEIKLYFDRVSVHHESLVNAIKNVAFKNEAILNELRRRWSHVCEAYAALQIASSPHIS